MWILQAQEAGALEGLHAAMPSAAARIAKLIFERVGPCHPLFYPITPPPPFSKATGSTTWQA